MKKTVLTLFVLLALLASTAGTVFAGSGVKLVGVSVVLGVPKFTFHVDGMLSKKELNSGFVKVVGGNTYQLYCKQVDAKTVVCQTTKKVAGRNVIVGFGGISVQVNVPRPRYCYSVYDWTLSVDAWELQGYYCQGDEAQVGDTINFYSPTWGGYYNYEYRLGDFCGWANPGHGYYYPFCP